jgi:DNA polymerase V
MSQDNPASTRGGKRPGAGRKARYAEQTQVMRVPISKVEVIKKWLLDTHEIQELALPPYPNAVPIQFRTSYHIPVALERVAAGFPSPADADIEHSIDLNEHMVRNQFSSFIVRPKSLSMRDAGIDIDDELVVDRSVQAEHGDIVIAFINNEFTLKRLMINANGQAWLKAENPDFEDIHPLPGQQLIIWGVVMRILKNPRQRKPKLL